MRRLAFFRSKFRTWPGKRVRFDTALELLGVSETGWLILERTTGTGNEAALAEIAMALDLPIERAERLKKRAVESIYRNFANIAPLVSVFEDEVRSEILDRDAATYEATLLRELQLIAQNHGWSTPTSNQAKKMLIALRALITEHPGVSLSIPKLTAAINSPVTLESRFGILIDALDHAETMHTLSQQMSVPRNPLTQESALPGSARLPSTELEFDQKLVPSLRMTSGDESASYEERSQIETPSEATNRLADLIAGLGLTDKQWEILDRRLGPGKQATLAAVASDLGVSRARVQQIQQKAIDRLFRYRRRLEEHLIDIDRILDAEWVQGTVGTDMVGVLSKLGAGIGISEDIQSNSPHFGRLVVALRAIVVKHPEFSRALPNLTFAACALEPPIRAHAIVSSELASLEHNTREAQRNWTYDELAEAVLKEEGASLHWSVMADRAERLGRRRHFSKSAFFNAVQANDDKFARVDSGTYGLTEWGLKDVVNYTDLVAQSLGETGGAMTEGAIFQIVSSQRPVEPGSLKMLLDMNPRFYQSKEGTYGLRSWLPERHRQTLRTPAWLVEQAESYERVTRAEQRGYKVAEMISRDREKYPRACQDR